MFPVSGENGALGIKKRREASKKFGAFFVNIAKTGIFLPKTNIIITTVHMI